MLIIKKYCENAHVFLVNGEGATVKLTFIFFYDFLSLSFSLSLLSAFFSLIFPFFPLSNHVLIQPSSIYYEP